jgi:hypothetical protein
MKEMFSLLLVGLGAGTVLLSGCAQEDVAPDRTGMLPADQRVSNIPGNPPQGWENKGPLGALQNDPRIGGQQ